MKFGHFRRNFGQTYTVDLNPAEAEAARDALGKALYDRLFAWLVGRVNKSTAPIDDEKVASTIGVLDTPAHRGTMHGRVTLTKAQSAQASASRLRWVDGQLQMITTSLENPRSTLRGTAHRLPTASHGFFRAAA